MNTKLSDWSKSASSLKVQKSISPLSSNQLQVIHSYKFIYSFIRLFVIEKQAEKYLSICGDLFVRIQQHQFLINVSMINHLTLISEYLKF